MGEAATKLSDVMNHLLEDLEASSRFQVTVNGSVIEVERDGLIQIYVDCHHMPRFAPNYLKEENKDRLCVIAVGHPDELEALPPHCLNRWIQQLPYPCERTSIASFAENNHNLLARYHDAIESTNDSSLHNSDELRHVLSISRELNGVRNIPKLLNLILKKAREITQADAGSIYTVNAPENDLMKGKIAFRFTQNNSVELSLSHFELPINEKSVVGNAVIHRQAINIQDLYKLSPDPAKNPFHTVHDRSWDERTGYESHSMLTVPMFDISHKVIGVIQLINSKKIPHIKLQSSQDFIDYVQSFSPEAVEVAKMVGQQAGIALENAKMQTDIENLFKSFVNASVTAIEIRDPTTSGHSHRVATLTTSLAKALNRIDSGPHQHTQFDEDEMREIEYASLLHDFGKVGVREDVLLKAKKLYGWQENMIKERFARIASSIEIEYLRQVIDFRSHAMAPMGFTDDYIRQQRDDKLEELNEFMAFIMKANEPTILEQEGFEFLKEIANRTFEDLEKKSHPYLKSDELRALSISRGSLTAEEFGEIQSHVSHTYEFLRKIPWGERLANVPQIAAKHHEKLDGTGYPHSSSANDIPIQSRMMTIADIFDALTAADRPYKKAAPKEKALDILNMEVRAGKIDKDLFSVFLESGVYKMV
ncbi:MAG: HD domain-containing phosphohydrolase [Oligoflexales bacterium]